MTERLSCTTLFANYVTIGTDKTFAVFVEHDVHVQTAQKAGAGHLFDH